MATAAGNVSMIRQNFHSDSEAAINRQINLTLYASYVYMSMAGYFDRDDLALPGFGKYFKKQGCDKTDFAHKLMGYQNLRGGRIVFADVKKPERDEWGSGLEAMQNALEIEKNFNSALLELTKLATKHNDAQLEDFMKSSILKEQVELLNKLGKYVTVLNRVGRGLGEQEFDREVLQQK